MLSGHGGLSPFESCLRAPGPAWQSMDRSRPRAPEPEQASNPPTSLQSGGNEGKIVSRFHIEGEQDGGKRIEACGNAAGVEERVAVCRSSGKSVKAW